MNAADIWQYGERSGGCWVWTRARDNYGYGVAYIPGLGRQKVHRLAWVEAHGPIPPGYSVLHHCDVPACFSVGHLFLGTQLDNMQDMWAKGRGVAWKGPHRSETKAKMSASRMGHAVSEATARRISQRRMGHTTTPETRAKISATLLARRAP